MGWGGERGREVRSPPRRHPWPSCKPEKAQNPVEDEGGVPSQPRTNTALLMRPTGLNASVVVLSGLTGPQSSLMESRPEGLQLFWHCARIVYGCRYNIKQ